MSRGPGRVELRIIELMEGADHLPAAKIAWWVAGRADPSPALSASVRRAVAALNRKGFLVRAEGHDWMLAAKWRRREAERSREETRAAADRERASKEAGARAKEEEARRRAEQDTAAAARANSPAKSANDIARLVKVLGLLGSSHDGEALSAARQAEQIRHRLGLGWNQLIVVRR